MADTATVGQDLEGRVLGAVHTSNSVAFEVIKVWADVIKPVIEALPDVTPPLAYDFAVQIAASQRKLAADVLRLGESITPGQAK